MSVCSIKQCSRPTTVAPHSLSMHNVINCNYFVLCSSSFVLNIVRVRRSFYFSRNSVPQADCSICEKISLISVLDLSGIKFPWYAVFLVCWRALKPTSVNQISLSTSSIPFMIL